MKRYAKRLWLAVGASLCVVAISCGSLYVLGPLTVRPCDFSAVAGQVSDCGDADCDGVPDGKDILESALRYVATRPVYESRYYSSGYPDDGFGVCTDVVAFGCLGAGFDLRELVSEDVALAPEEYDVSYPDMNIDFRRVAVLKTFLKRNALSLTCDLKDKGEWQGGDIVVFGDHVGIVSDRRTLRGTPYLVHHAGRFQLAYEEDALGCCGPIEGHYRMS